MVSRLIPFGESGSPPEPVDGSDDDHACDDDREKDEEEEDVDVDEDKQESSCTMSMDEAPTDFKTTEHGESTSGPSARASSSFPDLSTLFNTVAAIRRDDSPEVVDEQLADVVSEFIIEGHSISGMRGCLSYSTMISHFAVSLRPSKA